MGEVALSGAVPLVPARMLNEFAYCPRLAYLEWVQGEFEDSADTVEGRFRHRRVDQPGGPVPEAISRGAAPDAEERPATLGAGGAREAAAGASALSAGAGDGEAGLPEAAPIHARSLLLSSERLGAIARMDLLEGEGTRVTPVDYKRGRAPDIAAGAWEPERVQVCLQGLILRDNGFECEEGIIYYAESRTRVRVAFDAVLIGRTLELLAGLKEMAAAGRMPPPLTDSKKCPRCSLVGICLPDEITYLAREEETGAGRMEVRRLYPARDDALPLYVQTQGATVAKEGEVLQVRCGRETLAEVRLLDVSQVCLFGQVQITAAALRELCEREIPVCHFSYGGRFWGLTQGMAHKNVELRRAQFRCADDPERSLALARTFIRTKVLNCRTLLRRNHREPPPAVLRALAALAGRAGRAPSLDALLGVEGTAARTYFAHFGGMLKPRRGETWPFDFRERNRRPPRDPVNALLSFAYALLTKDVTVTLLGVGFDPHLGFYHQPRYGRPSLALDLMEEFRPLVADSVVLSAVNNGEVEAEDFLRRAGAVALTDAGRRKFLEAYERRMDTLVTHPLFGYRLSYRRLLEVQARLLARHLLGELGRYPAFRTR